MSETPYQRAKRDRKAYVKVLVSTRFAEPSGVRWEVEIGTLDPEQARDLIAHVMTLLVKP